MTRRMTTVPTPAEQLSEFRRAADRLLSLLLALHLPAALGLAALHGSASLARAAQYLPSHGSDVLAREAAVLVERARGRARAERRHADDRALVADPAMPAERRGRLDRHAGG